MLTFRLINFAICSYEIRLIISYSFGMVALRGVRWEFGLIINNLSVFSGEFSNGCILLVWFPPLSLSLSQ